MSQSRQEKNVSSLPGELLGYQIVLVPVSIELSYWVFSKVVSTVVANC